MDLLLDLSASDILDGIAVHWDEEFVAQTGCAGDDTGDQNDRRPRRCGRARLAKKKSSLGLAGVVLKRKRVAQTGASTYERRKTEMLQLGREAQELATRFGQLQQASQSRNCSPQFEVASSSRWKELAKRQRSLRREAERANKQLRLAVASQTQMAKSLDQVLRRRVVQACNLKMNIPQSSPWRSLECSAGEQFIYRSLLEEISEMRLDIDCVAEKLQSKIEETSNGSFSRSKVLQTPELQQPFLEFVRSEVVPFPRGNVDQAICTLSGGTNVEMRQFATEAFGAMDDIVMNKMQLSYSTPEGSGHLQLRTVMRHIAHAERSVFLSVRFYDNVHFEGQLVDGFQLHERKWTVLETDGEVCDTTAATCNATRIQAYSRVGPESTVLQTPTNWNSETLLKIVAPAWTMAMSLAQRKIESILLAHTAA